MGEVDPYVLTGSVPEAEVDGHLVDHDVARVVVEHGGNVVIREAVGGV